MIAITPMAKKKITEQYLLLGWVDVDVDVLRGENNTQINKGMRVSRQEGGIHRVNGLLDGVRLHKAIVDEQDKFEFLHVVIGVRNETCAETIGQKSLLQKQDANTNEQKRVHTIELEIVLQ